MSAYESNNPDLAMELKSYFAESESANKIFEETRQENLALYIGAHWSIYDEDYGQMKSLIDKKSDEKEGVRRVTVNLARKCVETLVSQVLGSTPIFEVIPMSDAIEDIRKAYASERLLKILWDKLKVVKVLRSARRISEILGDCYVEPYWDWTKGRYIRLQEKEGETFAKDRFGIEQNKNEKEGDISLALRFPDTVYPDTTCWDITYNRRNFNDARWVFLEDIVPISEIKANEDFNLPDEINKTDKKTVSFSQKVLYQLWGKETTSPLESEDSKDKEKGFCRVLRYYLFPNEKYPRGRTAIILPDNNWWFLQESNKLPPPFENDGGILPLIRFYSMKVEGHYVADSRLKDAGSLILEYDKIRSLMLDKLERYQPIINLDRKGGVTADDFVSRQQGFILESDWTGGKPPVDITNLSPAVLGDVQYLTYLKSEIEDIFYVHEPQRSPTQRRTYGEVALIQSYDLSRIKSNIVQDAEEGYEDLAKVILLFAKHYYSEPRIFNIMGENNRMETYDFKNSDIAYHDIKIQPASSMPASKFLQQQKLMFLIERGYFPQDEKGQLEVLNHLDLKELVPMRESKYDETNASNENYDMLVKGKQSKPLPEDNDDIHLKVHRVFKKTPEFRNNPRAVGIRILLEQHEQMHEEQIREKLLQQEDKLQQFKQMLPTPPQDVEIENQSVGEGKRTKQPNNAGKGLLQLNEPNQPAGG